MSSAVYLNIGSNSGDRRAFIARAVAALSEAFPQAIVTVSGEVESPPWGFESPNPFLNVGVRLDFADCSPWTIDSLHGLLDITQGIERSLSDVPHRTPDGSYRDREVDIGLIAVDELTISSDRLVIPHPHMALREFVLRPMAELGPGWKHPLTGLSAAQMLSTGVCR